MDTTNPYSIELRYTLDLMGYMLHSKQPRSVRIYSDSPEMVKACVRRLAGQHYRLVVNSVELSEAVLTALGVVTTVAGDHPADAAFMPLSLDPSSMPPEHTIVAALYNAFSYKTLLYPGTVRTTVFGSLAKIKRQYHVKNIVGLYSPRFIAMLGLAHLAKRGSTAAYFRMSDRAMQYLYDDGPLWRGSYVVVFTGHR